jgi:uncharacterized protein (TIGR03437 family)
MRPSASLIRRLAAVILLAVVVFSLRAAAASDSDHDEVSGSYPGRILNELALHRQALLRRPRTQFQTQSTASSAVTDVGNIVVMPDDGTLVTSANFFDLELKSLTFQPSGGGYAVAVGTSLFDAAAASQGILLNPAPASNPQNIGDDGTRQVTLPFPFSFFGTAYNSVFINSDGNLTFGAGDNTSTARSLGRFLAGAPRIAPYFADLDPSLSGQLTYLADSSRFVVTWTQVGDYAQSGIGPRETFQVTLLPGGGVQFSYSGIHGSESVVGISPGHLTDAPAAIDLSTANGQSFTGPAAEVFTGSTSLDVVAVAQRFYQTHEDAYQYLVLFTNFEFNLGNNAFAYELNVANQVTGLGQIGLSGTFDFASDFGSARLESLLNMGNIAHYPANPSTIFLRGVDSTLSVMGQESGHRFEAYTLFVDPETGAQSTELLGRALQHWSFFFNSDGSVVEGNRIRDNGNGSFTTIGAVDRYSELDQYLWGLREPGEVSPTFLVKNPSLPINPGSAPTIGVTFSGHRVNVSADDIIAANGLRTPNSVTSRKRYNYAYVLVIPRGSQPSAGDVAHLDTIRQAWEGFYAQATSFRATANTALVRALEFTPSNLGIFPGAQQQATVEIASAGASDVAVQLTNSNPAAIVIPSQVVIPAGSRTASFPLLGLAAGGSLSAGRAVVTADAAGYEKAFLVVQVLGQQSGELTLEITGGDYQNAAPGTALPQPLSVTVFDSNRIPYAGAHVTFTVVSGDASVSPTAADTGPQGPASTQVQFGSTPGPVTVRASVPGTSLSVDFTLGAFRLPSVPSNGIVNGASFAPSATQVAAFAPGSIISIFGTDLADTPLSAGTLPLPTTLAGITMWIEFLPEQPNNGRGQGSVAYEVPLFFVSPTQINAQIPSELPLPSTIGVPGHYHVRFFKWNFAAQDIDVSFDAVPASPGIFTLDSSGHGAGAILHNATGAVVSSQNPAVPDEFVQIYSTGLGAVSPAVASGVAAPSNPPSSTTLPVTVSFNGTSVPASFAGLAPGFVALYQVNVKVPQIAPGTAQVVLTINGVSSPPVTMAVGSN